MSNRYFILIICLLTNIIISATNISRIISDKGHYYLISEINNHPNQEIMLESAIPGLLIGDSIFRNLFPNFDYTSEKKMNTAKIALHHNVYSIDYILNKDVVIGDGSYHGKLFILKGYNGIALPLQNYTANDSTNQSLYIDLQAGTFKFTNPATHCKSKCSKFKYDIIDGFPVITTEIIINSDTLSATIDSNFIVDYGNAALLFLMKNNITVQEILEDSRLPLSVATNKDGKAIAEGFYAEKLQIGNFTFNNVSIGVTSKLKSFEKFAGLIGLKFFQNPFIIDYVNRELIILSQ